MSITFSNTIKFSGEASYSPNEKYFAISRSLEFLIYETATLKPIQKHSFCDYIEKIQWSPDSTLILIGLFKRGVVEIKQIGKPEWICRLDDGLIGISSAIFSPDSRNVLTVSDNNIKMTIWSLTTKTTSYISFPKFSKKGISFTSNGNFMALALKESTQDEVGIYFLGNWSSIGKFATKTQDLQDVKWTFDNSSIIVIDSPLVCRLLVYTPLGDLLWQIEPYQYKLGIRNLFLSPNGKFISLGCYDQSVKVYNNISYTLITNFDHTSKTECFNNNKVNYFKEEGIEGFGGKSKYITVNPPVEVTNKMPHTTDVRPKMGIRKVEYSYDSAFMATKNDNMPNTLFIWEMMGMNLHTVIIQLREITDFKWSPNYHILFILSGCSNLYYFTLDSIYVAELPVTFTANEVIWNKNGRKFILKDPNFMIIGDFYSGEDEEVHQEYQENYGNINDNQYEEGNEQNYEERNEEMVNQNEDEGEGINEDEEAKIQQFNQMQGTAQI